MKGYKQYLIVILLAVALVMSLAVGPKPAKAQMDAAVTSVTTSKWIWEKITIAYNYVKETIVQDLGSKALDAYMSNLSYTVANELAAGAAGGKPLFRTLSIKDASQKALDAAGGEFLSELTKQGFDELGINLCDPSVEIKLTLSLSLIDEQAPPKPKCDWSNVKKNWAEFGDTFANNLVKFQLDPRGGAKNIQQFWKGIVQDSDAVTGLKLIGELNDRKTKNLVAQQTSAEECQGYIDKSTTISSEVMIHCSEIQKIGLDQWTQAWQTEANKKAAAALSKSNNTKSFSKIMKDAANGFVNTFSSKLLKQWIKKGTWSLFGAREDKKSLRDDLIAQLRGGADIRQPRNQDIFRDLKTTTLEKVDQYSILNDFVLCPEEKDYRQPDNCVIDSRFLDAINSGKTINEAISDGLIEGSMILVGKDDVLRNNSDDCYKEAFCYSNLVKLRKANIIPIGWELAALRSEATSPITLQQAIDCFEDTNPPSGSCSLNTDVKYAINGLPHNQAYHLIDGNWVLKAQKATCNALVNNSVLESSQAPNRAKYCADYKTCLRQDEKGDCIGEQYSYCTRSQNIWRFQGDICEDGEIYAGCLNFSNKEFGDSSLIESTLSYCTSDEAGCRRYSQDRRADGTWILGTPANDQRDLFLTKRAEECPEGQAGCHEYITMAPDLGVNIISNASFADNNKDNFPDGWLNSAGNPTAAVAYSTSTGTGILTNNGADVYQEIILLPNTAYALSATAPNGAAKVAVEACDINKSCSSVAFAGPLPDSGTCTIEAGVEDRAALLIPSGQTKSCTFITRDIAVGKARIYIYATAGTAEFSNLKLEVISDVNLGATTFTNYGDNGRITMNGSRVMCSYREVGCQGYLPSNNDPMIPAVINQDDLCPSECVGYATYTEQPTVFDEIEIAVPPAPVHYYNFIADTGTSCPMSAVGCEEFTNLDEVARGGEGREYYTNVRQCVLEFEGVPYYTWEGSDTEGYQLRTLTALKSNMSNGPCTNVQRGGSTCIDTVPTVATCLPADMATNPNCREFFDSNSTSFYSLQDRLIYASNDCHDYRRTMSESLYRIIPSISNKCSATYNNCRSYYGNTANNTRVVISDNFENGTYQPWKPFVLTINTTITLSTEALQNNGHSMKVTRTGGGINIIQRPLTELRLGKKYQLSFWLKSDANIPELTPLLIKNDTSGTSQASYHNRVDGKPFPSPLIDNRFLNIEAGNWNYYTLTNYFNPSGTFDDNGVGDLLFIIDPTVMAPIYVDNISLREITDSVGLIQNSWQTPVSCDQPFAGYYLGCQSYIDTNSKPFNLKSFNRLCREEAIGCSAVIDTHNSDNPFAEVFHAGDFSELHVASDTVDFLVPDPGKYCPGSYQGCSTLGMPDRDKDTQFTTVYKINDPDKYGSALCSYGALYCEEFNSSKGLYYFRYPGQQSCTYLKNVNISGNIYNGWFKTDSISKTQPVGCSHSDTDSCPNVAGDAAFDATCDLNLPAQTPASCPADKNLCTVFKDPMDPSNCDVKTNTGHCSDITKLTKVDCLAAGAIWTSPCHPYYYYDNKSIDEASCQGLTDRGSGCVLFYEGNHWNSLHTQVLTNYDTSATYLQNVQNAGPVSPSTCDGTTASCNANRLIKVNNDRQCSEWLTCKSSSAVWDSSKNAYVTVCDSLDTCIEYDSVNNITNCKKWAPAVVVPEPLTVQQYQLRTTGAGGKHLDWSDQEYTGYSIPNILPVNSLLTFNFSSTAKVDSRLVYPIKLAAACVAGTICNAKIDGTACVAGSDGCYLGECINQGADSICMVSPNMTDTITSNYSIQARGFAETDSPFPDAIVDDAGTRVAGYNEANVCQKGDIPGQNCEIDYKKVTYGTSGGVKYYPKDTKEDKGICVAGDPDLISGKKEVLDPDGNPTGFGCTQNADCDSYRQDPAFPGDLTKKISDKDGTCTLTTKVETFLNWQGICLERDESTPLVADGGKKSNYCNQWYPVMSINGVGSLFDNYREAGYFNPAGNDVLFCAAADVYKLEKDRYYCGAFNGNDCNYLIRVPKDAKMLLAGGNAGIIGKDYLIDGRAEWFPASSLFRADVGNAHGKGGFDSNGNCNPPGVLVSSSCVGGTGDYGQVGIERVEKKDKSDMTNNWFLQNTDFAAPDDQFVSAHSIDEIKGYFDTTSAGRQIELYFLDQDINSGGSLNDSSYITAQAGFSANWGPYCDLRATDCNRTGSCSWRCGTAWGGSGGGHDERAPTPGGDYHQIYDNVSGGAGAAGSVYDCRGGCGPGKSKVCRDVVCNPLLYHYYVKAELAQGPLTCDDSVCSSGTPFGIDATEPNRSAKKGLECLRRPGYQYEVEKNAIVAANFTDISQCNTRPFPDSCKFVFYIEKILNLTPHSDAGIKVENPAAIGSYITEAAFAATYGPVIYCRDFGSLGQSSVVVPRTSGSPCEMTTYNPDGAFDYMFDKVPLDIFAASNNCLTNANISPSYTGSMTVNRLVLKPGFQGGIHNQAMGISTATGDIYYNVPTLSYADGCLNYLGVGTSSPAYYGAQSNANCTQSQSVRDPSSCIYDWDAHSRTCSNYPIKEAGTPCNDMSCFQMCKLVADLDAEGDNSWVRTDIWWRDTDKYKNTRAVNPAWLSYYYKDAGFTLASTTMFTKIIDETGGTFADLSPDNYFGASVGSVGNKPVLVESPVNVNLGSNPSVATFFSTVSTGGNFPQLAYIFARVYFRTWNSAAMPAPTYDMSGPILIEGMVPDTIVNPVNDAAGPGYDPQIYTVCNNNVDSTDAVPCTNAGLPVKGMTVNNSIDSQVTGHESLFVASKFFYYAHPDHMPIKNIATNWGDAGINVNQSIIGKYKNALPECNPEKTMIGTTGLQGFGGLDRACRKGYKINYHNYEYSVDAQYACNGTNGKPATAEPAACYKPKVMVVDQWDRSTTVEYSNWVVVYQN